MNDFVIADANKKTGPGLIFLIMLASAGSVCTISTPTHSATADSATWQDVNLPADGGNLLQLFAQNLGEKAPSASSVGYHRDGVGASGIQARAPAIRAETGFDPVSGASEHLFIQFHQKVTRADLLLTYFYPHEVEVGGVSYNEQGSWRAYMGGMQVDEGRFISNANDGNFKLTVITQKPFDRLEFLAMPYVNDDGVEIAAGSILTDSSDFLIKHVGYPAPLGNSPLKPPSQPLKTGNAAENSGAYTAHHKLAAD